MVKEACPDIVHESPNVFNKDAFEEWWAKCPDEYKWTYDGYHEELDRMRMEKTQLVEETSLSERESEVVVLRAEGYGYEAIGHQIGVAPSTAGEYGQRAHEKIRETVRTIRFLKNMDEEWFVDIISDENR